jgi:hypothetical protein
VKFAWPGLPAVAGSVGLLCLPLLFSGCAPVAITALGVGASAGVTHSINGVAIRTLAASIVKVHAATLVALRKLGMTYETVTDHGTVRMVRAEANSRHVEIEYQDLTATATQIRVTVKSGGLFYDRATADEIISQTEHQLSVGIKST